MWKNTWKQSKLANGLKLPNNFQTFSYLRKGWWCYVLFSHSALLLSTTERKPGWNKAPHSRRPVKGPNPSAAKAHSYLSIRTDRHHQIVPTPNWAELVIESPCPCVYLSVYAIGCSFFRGLSLALRSHNQFQASHWSSLGNLETWKLVNLETPPHFFCESYKFYLHWVWELWCFQDLEEKQISESVGESVTEVFVEQPRLHRVC